MVKAVDCGSTTRGFESRRSPSWDMITKMGPRTKQMIRWIISFTCVLLFFCSTSLTAIAQQSPITPEQLQQGEKLAAKAFAEDKKGNFPGAEAYGRELIQQFPTNPAMGRNQGNARVSQNKLEEAIADFNQSIQLATNAADPYLNRGVAYEGLHRYTDAINDYNRVLDMDSNDPMAYNNRGNAKGGQGFWDSAMADYQKATEIAPNFAFAQANCALALYQTGEKEQSIRLMRNLLRKYPMFPDIRAALTAVLWETGKQGEAESNWVAAVGLDSRYPDLEWVANTRRWPPEMVATLSKFLNLEP